jgi:putative ABC transport system permease protein
VAIVNETFARLVWPGESPLDKPCNGLAEAAQPCRIIGLVGDSPYANFAGEMPATRYQPFLQTRTGRGQMALHVRIAGDPTAMIPLVRREVAAIDPTLPLFEVRTLADEVDAVLIPQRLMATFATAFGVVAMVLAAIGLYGLLSFIVVRRTSEVGLRMALGARRPDVVWLVVREALVLIVSGVVAGLAGGLALARLAGSQISGLLFGLDAVDPISFAGATSILALVALFAAFIPARRASRVDPAVALRAE